MNIKLLNNTYYSLFVCSFMWSLFWLSINTMPFEIYFFGENFIKSINSLRLVLALILSFLMIIYFALKIFLIEKRTYLFKLDFRYYFLILFSSYLIFLIFSDTRELNLQNTYLIILSLGTIFFSLVLMNISEINLRCLIIVNILFLICICFITILPKYDEIISHNFNFYRTFFFLDGNLLNQVNPRVTGLSRSVSILNIFLLIVILNTKNKFLNSILLILFLFLFFVIWGMQSRGSILCFYITTLFLLMSVSKFKNFQKIIFLIFLIFSNFTVDYIYKNKINQVEEIKQYSRILDNNSSGRVDIWKYSLTNYEYENIFGYGSQGDRYFLKKYIKKDKFGDNSSNAILYSFLSGGYLALLLIITIYIHLINRIKYFIFTKYKNNVFYTFSISIIVFFFVRSLFENSFSLFSIDYLLLFSSLLYVNKIETKKIP